MMVVLVPFHGTHLTLAFLAADQSTLKFITMISESRQIKVLYALIKDIDKKYADLNGVLMVNNWQVEEMIIYFVYGISTLV